MKISFSNKKLREIRDPRTAKVVFTETGETETTKSPSGQKTISINVGKSKDFTLRKLHLLPRQMVALARGWKVKKIAFDRNDLSFTPFEISEQDLGRTLAEGFLMANYEFRKYKTPPKGGFPDVTDVTITGKVSPEFRKGITVGTTIGEHVNATRELSNTPGGEMTPKLLAEAARAAAKGAGVNVSVLGVNEMKKLGMGAILGVGAGSTEEPKFIVMEYWGGEKGSRPIVLVGKGVTFDTGGLNLKPESSIYEMHMDMSGGAAVISAVTLAAKLKIPKNIIGLVPAVENMPSGSSYRPGDVLRSITGKTIEVLNTDAEGRIILADALGYAGRYNPRLVVDVATLTGAAMVAFGNRASAIFSKDDGLIKLACDLGEKSGDHVWPMPLWEEYEADIRGTFGDWANIRSNGPSRFGGAINAAVFLYQFTKDYPKDTKWLHIDIAPRMTATSDEFLGKGAAGAPVRLLARLLEAY